MSKPRFGAWTATADRLPDTHGESVKVVARWGGEDGFAWFSPLGVWCDGPDEAASGRLSPPGFWTPIPPSPGASPAEGADDLAKAVDLLRRVANEARGMVSVSAIRDGIEHGATINAASLLALLDAKTAGPGEATKYVMGRIRDALASAGEWCNYLMVRDADRGSKTAYIKSKTIAAALRECGMESDA